MLATAPWQKPPLGWKPDPDKLAAVGAVAWYMFNEGGGLTALDASGFDHHGSLGAGNAAPAWAPSPHGGGLVFDKIDDVVNCGSAARLDNLSALSLVALINPYDVGEGSEGTVVNKMNSSFNLGYSIAMRASGAVQLYHTTTGTDLLRRSNTGFLTYGTWSVLAVTWDGTLTATGVKLYLNGREMTYAVTQNGSGSRDSDAGNDLLIGNDVTGAYTFSGGIDSLLLCSRVLTAEELLRMAESPFEWAAPEPRRRLFVRPTQTLFPAAFAGSFAAGSAALTNANAVTPAAYAGAFEAGATQLAQEATLTPVAYDGGFGAGAASLSQAASLSPVPFAGGFEAGAAQLSVAAILLPAAFPGGFEAGDADLSWSANPIRVLDQRLTAIGRQTGAPVRVLDQRLIVVGRQLPNVRVLDQRVVIVAAPHQFVIVDAPFDTKRLIGETPLPGGVRIEQAMVDAFGHWQIVPVVHRGRPFRAKLLVPGGGTSTFVLTLPPLSNTDGAEVPLSAGWPGTLKLTFQRGSLTHALGLAVDTYTPTGAPWTVLQSDLATAPLPSVAALGIFYDRIVLKLTLPEGAPLETVRLVGTLSDG
ncbi:MAG: LamG domain-containing protein, partial [Phycisphaerales bacterium]|nr:LamG domain-containing protein [Phycisphaerales bacterium]